MDGVVFANKEVFLSIKPYVAEHRKETPPQKFFPRATENGKKSRTGSHSGSHFHHLQTRRTRSGLPAHFKPLPLQASCPVRQGATALTQKQLQRRQRNSLPASGFFQSQCRGKQGSQTIERQIGVLLPLKTTAQKYLQDRVPISPGEQTAPQLQKVIPSLRRRLGEQLLDNPGRLAIPPKGNLPSCCRRTIHCFFFHKRPLINASETRSQVFLPENSGFFFARQTGPPVQRAWPTCRVGGRLPASVGSLC